MKRFILCLICILFMTGCQKNENPIVTMEIKDYGEIQMELYPSIAPNTVANFVTLVESGFYDGNSFHRLMPGFVLQGGDPTGTGTGGPGYTIKGEFAENGVNNNLSHITGVVSMARAEDYDTAGSQFFIVLSNDYTSSLDKKYASFGKVIKGMDVIKKIEKNAEIEDEKSGKLKENIEITKATVETYGVKYSVKKINN